jgi:hypothetical protein
LIPSKLYYAEEAQVSRLIFALTDRRNGRNENKPLKRGKRQNGRNWILIRQILLLVADLFEPRRRKMRRRQG